MGRIEFSATLSFVDRHFPKQSGLSHMRGEARRSRLRHVMTSVMSSVAAVTISPKAEAVA